MAAAIQAYVAHYHPLLGSLMQQMGLVETINEQIGTVNSQAMVDSGTMVTAMIHNILGNEPIRLYRLEHFFADKPLPLLFPWQPEVALGWLNDDRAGRVLDEIWAAGPQKLFSAVSQRVIKQYQLEVDSLHLDSTSKSFHGAYEGQQDERVPQLRCGYSKDHQPELVQLLFGVGTTREGGVVYGDVASGNTQDMVANGYWISQVRQQLGLGDYDFLLYVADSAAVTEGKEKVMRLFHQDLIWRLPGRYGLHDRLLELAPPDLAEWDAVGVLVEGQQAARTLAWQSEAELAGAVYRFLVLWSDKLAAQHRHTLHRQLTKEWEKVVTALAAVEGQRFEEERLAQAYGTAFLAKHKTLYHQLNATVEPVQVELPTPQRGRPANGASRPTAIRYRLRPTVTCDLAAYRHACRQHGKFILITSLRDRQRFPARAILAEYKEQHTAERAFRFMKDPTWVGAFCLKKPERIAAFAYILLIAAMVYTLWQRQVRRALLPPEENPLLGLDNRPTKRPTAYALKTILSPILVLAIFLGGQCFFRPAQPLTDNQKRVLTLAGFGEHIYHWQGILNAENYHSASP